MSLQLQLQEEQRDTVNNTHADDKVWVQRISEQRLWEFTEVELEQTSNDVNVAVFRQLCCHFSI